MKKYLWIIVGLSLSVGAYAENSIKKSINIEGKEIVERLTRLEEGQKLTHIRMNEMDRRLSGQMTNIQNMIWVVLSGMFALVGFVIWDRRSALSPVISRNNELFAREERLEKALAEYSRGVPELKKILQSIGLL